MTYIPKSTIKIGEALRNSGFWEIEDIDFYGFRCIRGFGMN